MKRLMFVFSAVIALALTGCGGGGEDQPPKEPKLAETLTEKQREELRAQLKKMYTVYLEAKSICQGAFQATVNVAIQTQAATLPAMTNDACNNAVKNFLGEFKTVWNGQYANSQDGQEYFYSAASSFLSAMAPGMTLTPTQVAGLAMPTFQSFLSSLDPSLRSQLGGAVQSYANGTVPNGASGASANIAFPTTDLTAVTTTQTQNGFPVGYPTNISSVPALSVNVAGTTTTTTPFGAVPSNVVTDPSFPNLVLVP